MFQSGFWFEYGNHGRQSDGPDGREAGWPSRSIIEKSAKEGNTFMAFKNKAKHRLIFILSGLFFLVIAYVVATDNPLFFLKQEAQEIISQEDIIASVVNILCPDSRHDSGLEETMLGGSGTIFTPGGLILTNSHIIPQDEDFIYSNEGCLVVLPNNQTGMPEEVYIGRPIVLPYLSEAFDLAFIQIEDVLVDEDGIAYGEYPREFTSLTGSVQNSLCSLEPGIQLGDSVRIFGYPAAGGGYSLTITDGIISSFPEEGLIMTSAKLDAGNSGGIAVDRKGCMIGVPTFVSIGEYDNLGVIISSNLVLEFLAQAESSIEMDNQPLATQETEALIAEYFGADAIVVQLLGNELIRSCPSFYCEATLWGTINAIAIAQEREGEWYKVTVFEYGQTVPLEGYPYIKVVELDEPLIFEGWLHQSLVSSL